MSCLEIEREHEVELGGSNGRRLEGRSGLERERDDAVGWRKL